MDKNPLIVKSNALIEASYQLNLNEQRLILACISKIRRDEAVTDQIMYSISAAEFSKICETDIKTAYRDLEAAALSLKRRELQIIEKPNGEGRHEEKLIVNWVQSVKYVEGKGIVRLRFNHDMLPYLSELNKSFTSYKLKNVVRMSSSYGVRFYELIIQWKNLKEREVSIDWLREILQLNGKYVAIKDFKKYVLEPGMKDINKNSDLWAKWEQKKEGRKVTHLKFKFGFKEQRKPKSPQSEIKIYGIQKSIIEKHAKPGEGYKEAALRIKKLKRAPEKY